MEEHDERQFSSQSSNQSYAYGYPLRLIGPAGNNSTTIPPQRFPVGASHGRRQEQNIICKWMQRICWSISIQLLLGPLYYFGFLISLKDTSYPIEFRVDSFSVSHLNITNNQISGDWTIGLSLRNPNKYAKVSYEEFEASVFYTGDGEFLSRGNLTSFIQGPKNQTLVYVNPVGRLEGLNNFVADSIAKNISLGGIVDFDVKLRVKVKFNYRINEDPEYVFDVVCKGVQVKFSSSSSPKNGTGDAVVIPELTILEEDLQ